MKKTTDIHPDELVISNNEYRELANTDKVLYIKKAERIKISPIIYNMLKTFHNNNPEFIWFIVMECFIFIATISVVNYNISFFLTSIIAAIYFFDKVVSIINKNG